MSIKIWFEKFNRKQKNVVVTASALSLLSIMLHNPLAVISAKKQTVSGVPDVIARKPLFVI